ncbi:MAG TPA: T9SS type A sorting domain-containing protein [Bacteroidia bacterium]|jgi:sugar lactone lactonase YvrE|nr:T9SS type A sorting domain-containing protein [Bacteroidia bacterium]
MKKTLSILFLFCVLATRAQIIQTIAGTGGNTFSGDGGPAVNAQLFFPERIALDQNGNVYFTDSHNNRIRKIDPSGIITTIAGTGVAGFSGDGGPAINAQLNCPMGITIDNSGNIFFTDFFNNRVRKISVNGMIMTIAGNGTSGFSGDGGPSSTAKLNGPRDVKVGPNGNIYIADSGNDRIRMVNSAYIISTVAGTGTAGFSGDNNGAVWSQLRFPTGICFDQNGNYYIADQNNNRIRMVNSSGIISTIAGNGNEDFTGDNGSALSASLDMPSDIAIDAAGNIFFADKMNFRIREIDANGTISTVAGSNDWQQLDDGGPAIDAGLHFPTGLAIDHTGNIFIADYCNDRIREVFIATGIADNNSSENIFFYPNPASDVIHFQTKDVKAGSEVMIVNSIGEIVSEQSITSTDQAIDISKQASGIYFLRVISDGEIVSQQKFVKE